MAGRGHHPELVIEDVHGWVRLRKVQVRTRPHQPRLDELGRVTGYRVQGLEYDLTGVLEAAEALRVPLREFLFASERLGGDP